jgi:hypothetical protein
MLVSEEQKVTLTPRQKEVFEFIEKLQLEENEQLFVSLQTKTGDQYELIGIGEISDKMVFQLMKDAFGNSEHFKEKVREFVIEEFADHFEKNILPVGKKIFSMVAGIAKGAMTEIFNNDEEEEEEEIKLELNENQKMFLAYMDELFVMPTKDMVQNSENSQVSSFYPDELVSAIKFVYSDFSISIPELSDALAFVKWPLGIDTETDKAKVMAIVR